jgi:pimeloyl-ACP methyl ester carboxylesterase
MARRTAPTAAGLVAATVGAFALVRVWSRQVRAEARAHALDPELLPNTRQHTVGGPNDTLVAVWDTPGDRDAVPQIVFVHGWMGTHHVWDWVVQALHGKAHMVTFDLPFHGQSGAPQPDGIDLDFFGDTLMHVIDDVVPSGPIVLVGHSLGGMIVLNCLRQHGNRLAGRLSATVLVSTAASFDDTKTALVRATRPVFGAVESHVRHMFQRGAGRVLRAAIARDTDLIWLFARRVQGRHAQPAITHGIIEAIGAAHPEALTALAPAVVTLSEQAGLNVAATRPLCVIAGSDDWLTPLSVTTALSHAAGAELVVLDGIGHVAPKEAADQVTHVIARYVGLHTQPQVTP